jgi:purine-nucleoside phosphorylase
MEHGRRYTAAQAGKTAARLAALTRLRPSLGIVLGSGFRGVVEQLRGKLAVPYRQLPGFPCPRVEGHEGAVLLGHLGKLPICVLSGRVHFYEGHELAAVTFPVRVLAAFGVRDLLLTNAAGGIRRSFQAGDFMCLTDHINLMGDNPLRGPAVSGTERFVDLSQVYDPDLAGLLRRAGARAGIRLYAGVYLAVTGPSYETPAEIRAFARWGADAVGMSTVPEAIVARQCGMRVAALSCITNPAAGKSNNLLSHADVLAVGERSQQNAAALIAQFAALYANEA